jgi:hypothetical protein
MIERYGWSVWDFAVMDAKTLIERGLTPGARRAGRNKLRSLERTRRKMEAGT